MACARTWVRDGRARLPPSPTHGSAGASPSRISPRPVCNPHVNRSNASTIDCTNPRLILRDRPTRCQPLNNALKAWEIARPILRIRSRISLVLAFGPERSSKPAAPIRRSLGSFAAKPAWPCPYAVWVPSSRFASIQATVSPASRALTLPAARRLWLRLRRGIHVISTISPDAQAACSMASDWLRSRPKFDFLPLVRPDPRHDTPSVVHS